MGRSPLHGGYAIAGSTPWVAFLLAGLVVGLWPAPGPAHAPLGLGEPHPAAHPAALVVVSAVFDRGGANYTLAGVTSHLTDRIVAGPTGVSERSYSIDLGSSVSLPGIGVQVDTLPFWEWSGPYQMPGGPDVLPGPSHWSWSVSTRGHADSGNWTWNPQTGLLFRTVPWTNLSYTVTGWMNASVVVTIDSNRTDGSYSPSMGFTLNGGISAGPGSRGLSTLLGLAGGIAPGMVRFGMPMPGAGVAWNNSSGLPDIDYTAFDRTAAFVDTLGADILLTLPVGSWGNGNYLPDGMPLNESLTIGSKLGPGFFPTPAAYASYVGDVVNHTRSAGEFVRYWTIGNEMPLTNSTVAAGYIQLFNLAESIIHRTFPHALVGSDVMTNKLYLPTFAADARNVGFLSFHFYAANKVCVQGGQYCPPNGSANEPTNPQIWVNDTNFSLQHFMPPPQAIAEWYSLTGHRLPDFDAEVNLDSGGGLSTAANGTDPRQQQIFAAPWIVATLINAEAENVSTFDYFTLYGPAAVPPTISGPYGGWGFGMSALGTNSNVTYFSPFWAMHLWASYLPRGSAGLATNSSDPYLVQAQAVRTPGGIGVALASAANTTVHVTVRVVGGPYRPVNGTLFDSTDYALPEDLPVGANISVLRDGVTPLALNASKIAANVTIAGGGIAMLTEQSYHASNGSAGNHSTNGSRGSGNGTGGTNSSKNSTQSSGSPGTGPNRPPPTGRGPASGLTDPSTPDSLPGALGGWASRVHDLLVVGAVALGWGIALLVGYATTRGPAPDPTYTPLRPRRRRR